MTVTQSPSAPLQHLSRTLLAADLADRPDADLVGRFADRRDEAAFAALVRRHGALVLGVCRRVLRHEQDAEDAFQATFLVLARDAASVRRAGAIANWLYGVAHNVARRAKVARHRRAVREHAAAVRQPTETPEPVFDDLKDVLDQELSALPEKYRAAVVLCDLTGLTAQRAAAEVGCPPKTLGTRLARGRELLARRLTRRGVAPAVGVAVLASTGSAAVPPQLTESAIRVGIESAVNPLAVGPSVAALTTGASNIMMLKTLKIVAVLTCGALLVGGFAMHGGFAAHAKHASGARSGGTSKTAESKASRHTPPADPLEHLHRFFQHVHDLLGIGPIETRAPAPDDKDKPALTGVWVKKDGELKIEFADKKVMNIFPHGENKVIVIVCEYTSEKDGLVKAKITGFEGKEEAKKAIMEKLPVGTEFSFKWTAKADAATLEDVKGDKDKAELLKSHMEAKYTKK